MIRVNTALGHDRQSPKTKKTTDHTAQNDASHSRRSRATTNAVHVANAKVTQEKDGTKRGRDKFSPDKMHSKAPTQYFI